MTVRRIAANIAMESVEDVQSFYLELLGLNVVMDMGWITTLTSDESGPTQNSIVSEGGSGTTVPDLSIEVDDVDATYLRAKRLGDEIKYELTDEPWGVRRFYVADPVGKRLIVLTHLR